MKINGEYPKFYMRVEGKRFAAIESEGFCWSKYNEHIECDYFKNWRACSKLGCCENNVIYVEVPEEVK